MNQKRNNDELLTTVFGSKEVLEPAPTDVIPQGMMYGHEIEMYTVEQGEKRDKRQ